MKQLILLFIMFLVACNGQGTSFPSTTTPGLDPATETSGASTTLPITETSSPIPVTETPSEVPPTETAASVTTFPDPNAYTWQLLVDGLQRPVDLQPDGSGRLFVI